MLISFGYLNVYKFRLTFEGLNRIWDTWFRDIIIMSEKFSLKWNEFSSNLSKTFGKLRNEDYFNEVTLHWSVMTVLINILPYPLMI